LASAGDVCALGVLGEAGKRGVVSDTNSSPQISKITVLIVRKVFDEKLLCKAFAD
jgi:hypothetical protein